MLVISCVASTLLNPKIIGKKITTDEETTKLEIPKTGNARNYSIYDNLAIAAGRFDSIEGFSTRFKGQVVADVFGFGYVQKVDDEKKITKDCYFVKSQSFSSLKNVAEKRFYIKDKVLIRGFDSVDRNQMVSWKNDCYAISNETYLESYGYYPNEMSSYIINQKTILNYKDLSNDDEIIYEITFDPLIACANYMCQVKTMAQASTYPSFSLLKATIHMTNDWVVTQIENEEMYDINMSGLGSLTCHLTATELFSYDIPVIEEKEFFKIYYNTNISGEINTNKQAVDYLQSTFGGLLTKEGMNFSCSIQIGDSVVLGNVFISITDQVIVYAKFNDLLLQIKDDFVYIDFENFHYKINYQKFLESIGIDFGNMDAKELLDKISMDETNDNRLFQIPIRDGLSIHITSDISDDSCESIALNVTKGTLPFELRVVLIPNSDEIDYSINANEYEDITSISWLVNKVLEIYNNKKMNIEFSTEIKGLLVKGNLNINSDGFSCDLTCKYQSFDFKITFINGFIYFQLPYAKCYCSYEEFSGKIRDLNLLNIGSFQINSIVDLISKISLTMKFDDSSLLLNVDISKLVESIHNVKVSISNKANNLKGRIEIQDVALEFQECEEKQIEIQLKEEYEKIGDKLDNIDFHSIPGFIQAFKNLLNKSTYSASFSTVFNDNGSILKLKGDVLFNKQVDSNFISNFYLKLFIEATSNHFIEIYYELGNFYLTYSSDFEELENDVLFNSSLKMKLSKDTLYNLVTLFFEKQNINEINFESILNVISKALCLNQDSLSQINWFKWIHSVFLDEDKVNIVINNEKMLNDLFNESIQNNISTITLNKVKNNVTSLQVDNLSFGPSKSLNGLIKYKKLYIDSFTPIDSNTYMDMDSVDEGVLIGMNTYELYEYDIHATLDVTMFLKTITIDADIKLSLNDGLKGMVKLEIPYDMLLTKNKTDTYLYIEKDIVYVKRVIYKYKLFQGYVVDSTEYKKEDRAGFEDHIVDRLLYLLNLSDFVCDQINKSTSTISTTESIHIDQILTSYKFTGNEYQINLNIETLTKTSLISEANLVIKSTDEIKDNANITCFTSLSGTIKVLFGLATVKLNCNLRNIFQTVDFSSFPIGIENDTNYQFF